MDVREPRTIQSRCELWAEGCVVGGQDRNQMDAQMSPNIQPVTFHLSILS